MQLYRLVKINRHPEPGRSYHAGRVGFVPVDATPQGEEPTVPVYLAMSCPMGFAPERLEEIGENGETEPQKCRVCGCTDDDCSGCIERTGQPCYWAEPDLCSACALEEINGES